MAARELLPCSNNSVEQLEKDKDELPLPSPSTAVFDSEAFDSIAAINSEIWNQGEEDETGLTVADLLPNGVAGVSRDALGDVFLRAAQTGVLEVVVEMLNHFGPSLLQLTDEDQYSALHRASYNGHVSVVKYLLVVGARVDAKTIDGWQPLHCACRWNKAKVASLLLQNGAKINSQTSGGQTPLHLAAVNNRAKNTLEMLLLNQDLNPRIRNGQGETALTIAERSGRFAYLFELVEESVDYKKFLTHYPLSVDLPESN